MIEQQPAYVIDEMIEPGLRYTEEVGRIVHTVPVRYCYSIPI